MEIFMKKIALILFAPLFIAGCREKANEQSALPPANTEWQTNVPAVKAEIQRTKGQTAMISEGWTLCRENEDGTMSSALESAIGDEVFVIKENGTPVQKKADWKFQNGTRTKDLNWVLVEFEGEEYWTRDLFIADEGDGDAKLAVVTAETHIYSQADDMAMTKDTLTPGKNVVVCGWPTNNSQFYELKIYNGKPYGKKIYAEASAISSDMYDIEMVTLLSKIEKYGTTKTELKLEVISELMDLYEKLPELKNAAAQ